MFHTSYFVRNYNKGVFKILRLVLRLANDLALKSATTCCRQKTIAIRTSVPFSLSIKCYIHCSYHWFLDADGLSLPNTYLEEQIMMSKTTGTQNYERSS